MPRTPLTVAATRRGVFRTVVDAIVQSRMRTAERHVAAVRAMMEPPRR